MATSAGSWGTERDLFSLYLEEIGRHPLLGPEEEVELAERIGRGRRAEEALSRAPNGRREGLERTAADGRRARERFIRSNLRLVVSVARKYDFIGLPLLDLIQEGNLGLMRAVDGFDPARGYRFSTYATWWIRKAILDAADRSSRGIRVPSRALATFRRIRQTEEHLRGILQRDPTLEEVSEWTGIPSDRITRLRLALEEPASLNAPRSGDGRDLVEVVSDGSAMAPPEAAAASVLRGDVRSALSGLRPRDRRVIELRYGFVGGQPHSLEEIGKELGVSRERVRQLEQRALRLLRSGPSHHLIDHEGRRAV